MHVAQKTHIVYTLPTPSKLRLIKQVTKVQELEFPLYSALPLCFSPVRSHLECCVQLWPQHKTDMVLLEWVHKAGAPLL